VLKKIKDFFRQVLNILLSLSFLDLYSFYFNFIKLKKKVGVLLNVKPEKINIDPTAQEKYLNYKFWLKESLLRAYKLNLHNTKNKKNILDIGTGAGYFPFICNELNHNGFCLDVSDNDLYNQMTDSLGLIKFERYIKCFEPINLNTDIRFDLITAYMICFNNHKQEDLWKSDEWRFFISDLESNYLKRNGLIVLNFNEEEPGVYFSDELITFFNNENYQIDGNTILIKSSVVV
tara:strand:- start:3068 stop:3766 length:699 start_codon:yes stop_codon:yes gene_type:complete